MTVNISAEARTQLKDPQSFLDASLKFRLFPVTLGGRLALGGNGSNVFDCRKETRRRDFGNALQILEHLMNSY